MLGASDERWASPIASGTSLMSKDMDRFAAVELQINRYDLKVFVACHYDHRDRVKSCGNNFSAPAYP